MYLSLFACVCVGVRVVLDFTNSSFSSVCVSVCVLEIFLCVHVWQCGLKFTSNYFLLKNLSACIYMYM